MNKPLLSRCLVAVTAFLAMVGLTSCFQMESVMHLNTDGSGTVTNRILVSAQVKSMMESQGKDPFSEAELKANGEKTGMTLKSVEKTEENGFSGVVATYEFSDITKVKLSPQNMQNGKAGGGADEVTFAFTPGSPAKLEVKLPIKEGAAKPKQPGQPDLTDPQVAAMVKGMVAGAKMKMVIDAGSDIVKTNATHVEGNKVTILEMNLEEMVSDPKGLEKMQSLEGGSPFGPSMQGLKGVKAEANGDLEIEFK